MGARERLDPTVVAVARTEPADDVPLFATGRARRLRRRRRILSIGGAGLALILLAGTVFVLTQRNVSTEVGLDAAIEQFRKQASGVQRSTTAGDDAPAPVAAEAPQAGPRAPVGAGAAEAAVGRPSAPVTPKPYVLPPEGVYAYRTTGGEKLSTFGASHAYPERTFATVRHLDGCRWEQRNDVIEEHVDIRRFCASEGMLQQIFYEAQVTFFGVTDGAAVTCDPPPVFHRTGMEPGHADVFRCSNGTDTSSEMTVTFVGAEVVPVGADTVRANKITITGTTSGRVVGTSSDTLWLDPTNGLTVRWERKNDNVADAFGGARVRYQEEATFLLESLEPQR
jgi:hypothetical protein